MNTDTFTLDTSELNSAVILAESMMDDAHKVIQKERELQEGILTAEATANAAIAANAKLEQAKEQAKAAMMKAVEQYTSQTHHQLLMSIGGRDFSVEKDSDAARYYATFTGAVQSLQGQVDARISVLDKQIRDRLSTYENSVAKAAALREELDALVVTDADRELAAGLIDKWRQEAQAKKEADRLQVAKMDAMAGTVYKKVCTAINQMSKGAEATSDLWLFIYEETLGEFAGIDWQQKEQLAALWLSEQFGIDESTCLMAVRQSKADFRASKRGYEAAPVQAEPEPLGEDDKPEHVDDVSFRGGVTWKSGVTRHEALHDIFEILIGQYSLRADIVIEALKVNDLDQPQTIRFTVGLDRYKVRLASTGERGEYRMDTSEVEAILSRS